MNSAKYIGLDVHQATIAAAVMDHNGKLVMEAILETKAATVIEFVRGISGDIHVTLEEGTCAAWLHDLLLPHVNRVIVCDPRKNALLKQGNKSDKVDARKLAELLRTNLLSPVYHGATGVSALRELARSYMTLTHDSTRVMNRIKAVYHGRGIPCPGQKVYSARYRVASGWRSYRNRAGVAVRNGYMSSSTVWDGYGNRRGTISYRKAGNIKPPPGYVRSHRSEPSARPCWSR